MKSRRMRRTWHPCRMWGMHTKFLSGKPEVQKQFWRPDLRIVSKRILKKKFVSIGVTVFFLLTRWVITMAAPNRNYELKKKIAILYLFPSVWLNKNLSLVENYFLFKLFILPSILPPLGLCCPGRPHHSPPRHAHGCGDVVWIHLAKGKDYGELRRVPSIS